jgi:hypothetical protein
VRRGILDVKAGGTRRLTQSIGFKPCRPDQQRCSPTATLAPALRFSASHPFGVVSETLKGREVLNQSGLREILIALAAGRNVSARISPPP